MIDALDLFAGAGGLSLGLSRAGIVPVCAVENDIYASQSLALHLPRTNILCTDIRNVDLSSYRGRIPIVYGGPPCQPFSSGGRREAAQDKRDMLPWFVQAVDKVRPDAFLMENVPGLLVGGRNRYFTNTLEALSSLGYFIVWNVVNSADYGVPQSRRRLFIVGMRKQPFLFPQPTHGPERSLPHVAVQDVLPTDQLGESNPATVTYAKNPELRPSPYHGLLFNGGGRPIDRVLPAPTILASAGGNKTHFFDTQQLVPEYHRYLAIGGAPRQGVLTGARRLTILESAILQTFPRDAHFQGPRSAQYQQIGNAVPPLLATILGYALRAQMEEYASPLAATANRAAPIQLGLSLP